jgi:hypothetical protein
MKAPKVAVNYRGRERIHSAFASAHLADDDEDDDEKIL